MSVLLDSLLTEEQRASCAIHDVPKEWPVEAAHACTELGADQIRAESKREARGFWWAMPAVAALSILAAWLQFGSPL